MNGAESLVQTAVAAGVNVCFANPGTTEMQLVGALDSVPGMRGVLVLFEGVATGAADGYARMTGAPAMTLLHLGPGFANGIANLHNARRAHSPVFNVIGDHASYHVAYDAPLTSDIVSLASPVSGWLRTASSADALARDAADAIAAALAPPGQVATLIVPQDAAWDETAAAPGAVMRPTPQPVDSQAVEAAARTLSGDGEHVLLIGGAALTERGMRAAGAIQAGSGCRVIYEAFPARLDRGAGLPTFERLPYFPEMVINTLDGAKSLVLAGTREPVSFFAYPNTPSSTVPEGTAVQRLAGPEEDVVAALEAVAEAVGDSQAPASQKVSRPNVPTGSLDPDSLGQAIAALQPEGAIVVDEAATSGFPYYSYSENIPPHTLFTLTGGAIGQGLPNAVGAAVACPDRKVIAFQADGSAMYTLQALWTMAREQLDVTVVLCSNRLYRILQIELHRAGVSAPGPQAIGLTDLHRPDINWAQLAEGQGVPGVTVDTADAFCDAFRRAMAEPGPCLIEAVI